MLQLNRVFIFSVIIFKASLGGRIDVKDFDRVKPMTEANEISHIDLIMEKMMPSVSEDKIKVLDMKNGTIYDVNKAKGKPELFRKIAEALHAVKQTEYNEHETTTELRPESTSHSHVFERTANTKTTVHKTKTEITTEMSPVHHSRRSKRSFTRDELQSFTEMGKVFSESFKKFNEDASKAEKDFMSFMKKLDEISDSHDHDRYRF